MTQKEFYLEPTTNIVNVCLNHTVLLNTSGENATQDSEYNPW